MANFSKQSSHSRNQAVIFIQAVIIIALLIVLGISLGFIRIPGYSKGFDNQTVHQITYRITSSSGKAVVAFTQANGERSELKSMNTPWTMSFAFNSGATVYLLAGNASDSGDLTCEISMDGKLLRRDHAVYPKTKVACALPVY